MSCYLQHAVICIGNGNASSVLPDYENSVHTFTGEDDLGQLVSSVDSSSEERSKIRNINSKGSNQTRFLTHLIWQL